ncbi:hypothetical protein N1031_00620 [Herbiconiux moechotypicola]|uniref:Uncharacterized protein n=1 Tax=Herbiconiux moechotypicola TaxID=637393 RepID=A0ABN3D8E7_9MICO|nr:hypothetical protein [Herbiconiux moechotypicola]MCS5728254.1 hypothetical protein [Herbiconiux moechotypicola]
MSLIAMPVAGTTAVEPIRWSTPETKLWVGTRAGEYAGMIEYVDGHFVVVGATGRSLGSWSDLAQAMTAAESGRGGHRVSDALLSNVALASAAVAVSIAGLGLTMLAA